MIFQEKSILSESDEDISSVSTDQSKSGKDSDEDFDLGAQLKRESPVVRRKTAASPSKLASPSKSASPAAIRKESRRLDQVHRRDQTDWILQRQVRCKVLPA